MIAGEEFRSRLLELGEHDLRLQSTMIAFNENMKNINENIRHMADVSVKLSERIKVLESDLNERSIRKHLTVLLMTLYPLILGALIVFANLDRNKIHELIADMQAITKIIE